MNVLYKNATNRHQLCFSENPERFADILISYKQRGRVLMRRTKKDLSFEERSGCGCKKHWIASWELRPEETLRFSEKLPVFLQAIKVREDGGQEPGEIVELDVIESLDHASYREVNGFEPHVRRTLF